MQFTGVVVYVCTSHVARMDKLDQRSSSEPCSDDIVEHLNGKLHLLSSSFFNFIGALQRDAPPTSVSGEPVHVPPSYDLQAQTDLMATELTRGFELLAKSIDGLPETPDTEAKQIDDVLSAQKECTEAGADLQAALLKAKQTLERLQKAHALVTDIALQNS